MKLSNLAGLSKRAFEYEANQLELARRIEVRRLMTKAHTGVHPRFPLCRRLDNQVGPIVDGSPTLDIRCPSIRTLTSKMIMKRVEDFITTMVGKPEKVQHYIASHQFIVDGMEVPRRRVLDPNRPRINKEFGEGF